MKQRQIRYGDKAWNKLQTHVEAKKNSEDARLHHSSVSAFIRHSVEQQITREKK